MTQSRIITVELPADLIQKAQNSTGKNLTTTIRMGLELVAASRAADELRRLRGKVKFSTDLRKLREDRA